MINSMKKKYKIITQVPRQQWKNTGHEVYTEILKILTRKQTEKMPS